MSDRAGASSADDAFLSTPAARGKVGMASFLCSEAAFFGTLIVAYVFYRDQHSTDSNPATLLSLEIPLLGTAFLLSSSGTIALAAQALEADRLAPFRRWLAATILLACGFLIGTAVEWHGLIFDHGITIDRNLFGTTYFTLIGFHAFHVTLGALVMLAVLGISLRGALTSRNAPAVELISWYWHFVDTVWIVILGIVYLAPR